MKSAPHSFPLQRASTFNPDRAWLREQGHVHRKAAEEANRVRDASRNGKRMMPVMRNYLRNPQVRLSGALKALGGDASRDQAYALKDRVNAWSGDYAPIRWHTKKKADGRERTICTLPPELSAVHYMLKRPLETLLFREGNLFGIKGHSRDALAQEIKKLQNQGYVHIATTDIVDCYPSIDPDAIYELPIPKEVIRNALDTRYMEFGNTSSNNAIAGSGGILVPHGDKGNATGPRGLMQGSPLSSVILAWLLNGTPTCSDAQVFLCFDNLIVMAKSPNETRAMIDTLAAHFGRCPAGPLALHEPTYADNEPVEFLGYLFDPTRHEIGISGKALEKVFKKLNQSERVWERKQNKSHTAPLATVGRTQHPPLENTLSEYFPLELWKALRDFRAGFSQAPAEAPELQFLKDNSRWLAEWTGHAVTCALHDSVFADRSTPEGRLLLALLNEGII